MQIKLSAWFVVFFLAFGLAFAQLHEMAHLAAGRILCGAWGSQADFNLWSLPSDCQEHNALAYLATLAGPAFSFIMIYVGVYLLYKKTSFYQLMGFTFILQNFAFARLLTAAMGSGDEITALKMVLGNDLSPFAIKIIGFTIVLIIVLPPLYLAYKKLGNRHKWLWMLACCLLPLMFQWLYEFRFLNYLIRIGLLSEQHFFGVADLILLHTVALVPVILVAFFLLRNQWQTRDFAGHLAP